MDIQKPIAPVDKKAIKGLFVALILIVVALLVASLSSMYLLAIHDMGTAIYGVVLVWIGSMALFYALITEEHMMKEIFIRPAYFFTGLLVMIFSVFLISLAGLSVPEGDLNVMDFGVLLLILGSALVLLSDQRTRDYSRASSLIALFSGVFIMLGGLMAGSMNTGYAGIFIVILSGIWMGLRDRYAV